MQKATRSIVALALFAAAGVATAQTGPTSASGTGSVSSDQEVRRGVPGVDADVRTGDRGRSAGVPGVDVDARARATGDNDTRRSGAGPDMQADRAARADRN